VRIRTRHARQLRSGIIFAQEWLESYYSTQHPADRDYLILMLALTLKRSPVLTAYAIDVYISENAMHSTVAMLEMQGLLA
jgi:hypothetical protein